MTTTWKGKLKKHSRHLYDIHKLFPLIPQDNNLISLISEVRKIRAKSSICPSAKSEINIPELLKKIIAEKAYQSDYETLTVQLLNEKVSYNTTISTLKQIADSKIFG